MGVYKNAAKGKRYTPAVAAFEYDLEKNLIEIENDLKNETYVLGGYHSFEIDKPKRRLVNAAPFRDRVAHHALLGRILLCCNHRFPLSLRDAEGVEAISSQAGRLLPPHFARGRRFARSDDL